MARASHRLHLFTHVTIMGTSRTKAFKKAFSDIQLEPDTSLEASLHDLIDHFFRDTLLELLTTCIGKLTLIPVHEHWAT